MFAKDNKMNYLKINNEILQKIDFILDKRNNAIIEIYDNKFFIMATDFVQMYFYEKNIDIEITNKRFCLPYSIVESFINKDVCFAISKDLMFINDIKLDQIDYINWIERLPKFIYNKKIDGRLFDINKFLVFAKDEKVEFDFSSGDLIIKKEFKLNFKNKVKNGKSAKFKIRNIVKIAKLFKTAYIYHKIDSSGNLLIIYKNGKDDRHVYLTLGY